MLFEISGTKFYTMHIVYLGLILFVGWLLLKWFFSVEIPGHWLEKGSYEAQVYVNLFTDKDSSKNYRLVADIERYTDCDSDGEQSNCYSGYRVHNIKFPNEGYIEFDDCEATLNKKVHCIDYDGDSWYVELTNQKL